VPIVGLEPSCLLTLRDETVDLLRTDDARVVAKQSFLFEELLVRERGRGLALSFRAQGKKALLHGHCHQKALVGTGPTVAALRWAGFEVQEVDSGCCGMAGSFGFEREHYDISMKVGERSLLPAVRRAPTDALIVADGFSCRTQIAGATNRRALHLADVIEMAGREGVNGAPGLYPERGYVHDYAADHRIGPATMAAGGIVAIAAAAVLLSQRR